MIRSRFFLIGLDLCVTAVTLSQVTQYLHKNKHYPYSEDLQCHPSFYQIRLIIVRISHSGY